MDTGDTAWMLTASALVLLMTPGLAFFYGGLIRARNVVSTLMYSFMAMGVVSVVWVLWGYSLAFGDGSAFIGDLSVIGLSGLDVAPDDGQLLFVLFQMMFAIITLALITGAFVERFKFSTYLVFLVLWITLVYAPIAYWVWAEKGWLFDLGALDFAGGAVVHINAGMAGLAAAILVGKRRNPGPEPHNVPYVFLGASLLWFGWFGFNAGSGLAANGRAVSAFMVTNTSAAAALTWGVLSQIQTGRMSAVGVATGAVAGLVAITPAAGFVGVMGALAIGFGAGILCYGAVLLRSKTGHRRCLERTSCSRCWRGLGRTSHRSFRRSGHRRYGRSDRRQPRPDSDPAGCHRRHAGVLLRGHTDHTEGPGHNSRFRASCICL